MRALGAKLFARAGKRGALPTLNSGRSLRTRVDLQRPENWKGTVPENLILGHKTGVARTCAPGCRRIPRCLAGRR